MKPPYANIYDYADFRKFLKDYQENRQKEDWGFTKARFTRELGLPNTRSYFTNVLRDRHVTREFTERFISVLGLDKDESQYFRVLVDFNQATHDKQRELLFDQLISLNKTPRKFIQPGAYAYYSKWYHSAIRALLDVFDFKDDYKKLCGKFERPLFTRQVRESINLLKKLGFIQKNKEGFWKPTNKSISSGIYLKDELLKQYQLTCMELGKEALLGETRQLQNFSTVNLSLSGPILKKVEEKLQKFKSEVRSMVNKDPNPADRVYQLSIQLFPTTRKGEST